MGHYLTKENRKWEPVDVRGTMMDKAVIWGGGFDISSSLFRMSVGSVIKRHTHQHWVQVVVLEGEMQVDREEDGIVKVPAGGCYILTPGMTHEETALCETVVVVTQLNNHLDYTAHAGGSDRPTLL